MQFTASERAIRAFIAVEALFDTAMTQPVASGRYVALFNAPGAPEIPIRIRTGKMSFGSPYDRKDFLSVDLHGSGTFQVRIFGGNGTQASVLLIQATATAAEDPNNVRRVNIPVGKSCWNELDVEVVGAGRLRLLEIAWNPMPSD